MSRGNKPKGLMVKFLDPLVRINSWKNEYALAPKGWYVWFWREPRWVAILDVRYRREIDAKRGREALIAAGIYTYAKLRKAPALEVIRVMTECLAW